MRTFAGWEISASLRPSSFFVPFVCATFSFNFVSSCPNAFAFVSLTSLIFWVFTSNVRTSQKVRSLPEKVETTISLTSRR